MYKNDSSIIEIRQLKRPVLLQGPIGGFFNELMKQFIASGSVPFKINFNGGDKAFMTKGLMNVFDYTDEMKNFGFYFKDFLETNKNDGIILFGDCRPLHKVAKFIAKEMEVKVFVFEEGYIRPNFITLEEDGVNANSNLMYNLSNLLKTKIYTEGDELIEDKKLKELQEKHFHDLKDMGLHAIKYWWSMGISKEFPHYEHHKDGDMFKSSKYWFKSFFKKKFYQFKERNFVNFVENKLNKKYFLVALQVYNDSQIKDHSKFRNNKRFIFDSMKSFSLFANPKDYLVIKQHPLDIPYHDYQRFINELAVLLRLEGRVFYVHDVHLPTLLKHSKGLVTINSTTGLSALYHGTPVIALGKAMYDIPGLCFQGNLNTFWSSLRKPNNRTFKKFRSLLIERSQIVGSFYSSKHYPKIIEPAVAPNNVMIKEKLSIILEDRKEMPILTMHN